MVKQALAGTKLLEFDFPVERGKIREFAGAICDPNPVYRDSGYARRQGFPDVLMPPTFPATFVFHIPSENFVMEMIEKLEMNPATSVHGEVEILYERPVCAGETLRGEIRIGNIYEKEGKRGGKMTLVEMEVHFYDKAGKRVILHRNVFIERSQ